MAATAQEAEQYAAFCRKLLFSAAEEGNPDAKSIFKLLAPVGGVFNVKDDEGSTILHHLCGHSIIDLDLIRLVVVVGVDVNAFDSKGKTALHCLFDAYEDDEEDDEEDGEIENYEDIPARVAAIRILVAAGANVNMQNASGNTVLHWLSHGCPFDTTLATEPAIRELLRLGADLRVTNDEGNNLLHRFCSSPTIVLDFLRAAINAGVDVNAVNGRGESALHCLFDDTYYYLDAMEDMDERVEALSLLVAAGVNIDIRKANGRTVLCRLCCDTCVAYNTAWPAIRELIRLKADVCIADNDGFTALHWLAKSGSPDLMALLIDQGADVHARDNRGSTPLHCARWGENARLLISRGADPDALDRRGWKPIASALWNYAADVVSELILHTTDPFGALLRAAPQSAEECRTRGLGNDFVSPVKVLASVVAAWRVPFFEDLFNDRPIPAEYRRVLGEALRCPTGVAILEAVQAEVEERKQLAAARAGAGAGGAGGGAGAARAADTSDSNAIRKLKLKLLEDDAWEKRKHLVCCYFETRRLRREHANSSSSSSGAAVASLSSSSVPVASASSSGADVAPSAISGYKRSRGEASGAMPKADEGEAEASQQSQPPAAKKPKGDPDQSE